MALRHTSHKQRACFSSWPALPRASHHKSLDDWKQINLTNNSPGAARPAELMAEEVAKWIKDSTETVTLCYRNQLNRFMLLPLRVGKVLRANSQVSALAREVKSIRSSPVTDPERKKWKIDWQKEMDQSAYFCPSLSFLDYFLSKLSMWAEWEWAQEHPLSQKMSRISHYQQILTLKAPIDMTLTFT